MAKKNRPWWRFPLIVVVTIAATLTIFSLYSAYTSEPHVDQDFMNRINELTNKEYNFGPR